ncbi:hypothetical protein U0070_024274, partial [Myodes glareolus]
RRFSRVGAGRGGEGGLCGQRGPALPQRAPWLTGGPHLEFIASRRRKEEERRAGLAGSGGRRRLCPPPSCPGSPTTGRDVDRAQPAASKSSHWLSRGADAKATQARAGTPAGLASCEY